MRALRRLRRPTPLRALLAGWALTLAACAPPEQSEGGAPLHLPDTVVSPLDSQAASEDSAGSSDATAPDDAAPQDALAGADTSVGATDDTASGSDAAGSAEGQALYAKYCRFCHGDLGEGGAGPALNKWSKGKAALVGLIRDTMPPTDPKLCDAACAEAVASHILSGMQPPCALPPRRLRPLTRVEYRNTVADLLPIFPKQAACKADTDCELGSQSCTAGVCTDDPCTLHTFVFVGGAQHKSVHVSGAFNGWAPTVAQGGWPMTWVPAAKLWYVKKALPAGTHPYKLVLDDQTWILDPANPEKADNGLGGFNSVLTVGCAAGSGDALAKKLAALTASFPAESRPEGYPFDNHAATLVTSVHIEQLLSAGRALADLSAAALVKAMPCQAKTSACAKQWLGDFGRRAFRRPMSAAELERYAKLVVGADTLEAGVRLATHALLVSPHFLYRRELGAKQPDGSYRLDAWERASELSYLYWRSMPDATLLAAAASGKLDTTAGLLAEAKRLLADPRAREVVGDFALMWLGVEQIPTKNTALFPTFDAALRAAMREETRRFVQHITFDGAGTVMALFTAKLTFANSLLAKHYGLSGAKGAELEQIALGAKRSGLLGHGSVLATHAHSDQTSPIRRGLFVRQRLLCHEFPPPPANAGGVPDIDPKATTKERFLQHTADPFCKSCHQYIDDLGFGFERFDAAGQWRETEAGKPIDASGDLNDVEGLGSGTSSPFSSLPQLGQQLAASQATRACFTRMWWRFAAGAMDHPPDRCGVQALQARFDKAGWDIQALMLALVELEGFQRRRAP